MLRGQYLNPTILDGDDGEGQRLSWDTGGTANAQQFPKVPSDEGRKLMESGVFGTYDRRMPNRKALARRLLDRELGLSGWSGQKVNQGLMAQVGDEVSLSSLIVEANRVQSMIPSTKPEMVIHYDDPVCCGQFSDDGNFFYSCVKASTSQEPTSRWYFSLL